LATLSGCVFGLLLLSVHTKNTTCGSANGNIDVAVAGGTAPYQYSVTGYAPQQNGRFDQLTAGSYTLTVSDAAGLSADTVLVLTNSSTAPAVSIAASVEATGCLGMDGSVVLQAAGGSPPYLYAFEGAAFQQSDSFVNLLKGDYNFLVKDANGCGDSIRWFVNSGCTVGFTIGASIVNAGCTSTGSIHADPQGGAPPFTFSMDGINFQASGVFTRLAPGRYVLYVKDNMGQENYASYPVYSDCMLQITASATASDCALISGTISAAATGGVPPFQFSIDGIDFQSDGDFSGLQPGTYTVTVRDSASNIRSTAVTVTSTLIVNAGPPVTICQGGAAALDGFTNSTAFSWSPLTSLTGSQTLAPVASPASTTEYYLTAVSGSCRETDSVEVSVTPSARVSAGADTAVTIGQRLTLTAIDVNHSGFDNWVWTPVTGLDNPSAADPVLILAQYGKFTYTVTATAPGGCKAADSVTVTVFEGPAIYVPNAFTPNGDGHNDVLKAFPVGIATFQYFVVYNRSGQMIFYTADPQTGWDGRIAGHAQPPGAFVWVAAGIDIEGKPVIRRGTVLLVR
jgi:gliding motility-associated-like protein